MPWDGCELWLADVDDAGRLHGARRLAGSRDEAVQQPLWSPDGRLHFVSDRSGWWNLYRWGERRRRGAVPDGGRVRPADVELRPGHLWLRLGAAAGVQLRARRGVAAGGAGHGHEGAAPARHALQQHRQPGGVGRARAVHRRIAAAGRVGVPAAPGRRPHRDAAPRQHADADPRLQLGGRGDRVPHGRRPDGACLLLPAAQPRLRGAGRREAAAAGDGPRRPDQHGQQRLPRRRAVLDQPRHRRARCQLRRQLGLRPRLPPAAGRPMGRGRRDGLHPGRALPGAARRCRRRAG